MLSHDQPVNLLLQDALSFHAQFHRLVPLKRQEARRRAAAAAASGGQLGLFRNYFLRVCYELVETPAMKSSESRALRAVTNPFVHELQLTAAEKMKVSAFLRFFLSTLHIICIKLEVEKLTWFCVTLRGCAQSASLWLVEASVRFTSGAASCGESCVHDALTTW